MDLAASPHMNEDYPKQEPPQSLFFNYIQLKYVQVWFQFVLMAVKIMLKEYLYNSANCFLIHD
jgi:hypothetical protein